MLQASEDMFQSLIVESWIYFGMLLLFVVELQAAACPSEVAGRLIA